METEGGNIVTGLGGAGIFLSFVIIAFAAASISASGNLPSVFVILLSIATAIFGGILVSIFIVLSLLGGILVLIGARKNREKNSHNKI